MTKLPEVAALDAARDVIRISPDLNVPITPRVRRLIDTAAFRRLSRISQLGLVALVYPAATHTRFEHSLGVYRQALLFLRQLSGDPRFGELVTTERAGLFVLSALLHDLGHWPFAHPIEDLHLEGIPRHEEFVTEHLESSEVATLLRDDWGVEPSHVADLLAGHASDRSLSVLRSMLSGPIDIDKLDYLSRDSIHAGVPYGHHFDQNRLIASLCLNEAGSGLAISEKGKTAAELMVFARYVMFSEVYWHHAVRAATAMFQRAFFLLAPELDLRETFRKPEAEMVRTLLDASRGTSAEGLLDGLFGPRRRLFKRVAQYSYFENRPLYDRIAYRPYSWLREFGAELARIAASRTGAAIPQDDVLVDAPPVEKEVEFRIDVYFPKTSSYRPLEDVSPVVRTLAREQFDDYVKRVRIFASPAAAEALRGLDDFDDVAQEAATRAPT